MPDEIFVDAGASPASRILVDGVWYTRVAPSDEAFSVVAEDIDEESCDFCCTTQGQVFGAIVDLVPGCFYPQAISIG